LGSFEGERAGRNAQIFVAAADGSGVLVLVDGAEHVAEPAPGQDGAGDGQDS